jgi:hypothetical protein
MSSTLDKLARSYAVEALATLREVMRNRMAKDSDRRAAADSILDRGYGKPQQAIISIPASKQQQQALAALGDDELMVIIKQKPLPRLSAPDDIEGEYEDGVQSFLKRDPLLD